MERQTFGLDLLEAYLTVHAKEHPALGLRLDVTCILALTHAVEQERKIDEEREREALFLFLSESYVIYAIMRAGSIRCYRNNIFDRKNLDSLGSDQICPVSFRGTNPCMIVERAEILPELPLVGRYPDSPYIDIGCTAP